MDLRQKIVLSYEFFCEKLSGYDGFEAEFHEREKVLLWKFARKMDKRYGQSIGYNWLFEFFTFQYEYWSHKTTRYKFPLLSWIIGDKAFERWKRKPKEYIYFNRLFLKRKEITFDQFRHHLGYEEEGRKTKDSKFIFISEELEKQRYYGSKEGFRHCLLNTTLYNHRSSLCEECIFSETCKDVLKDTYSIVFKERGYA